MKSNIDERQTLDCQSYFDGVSRSWELNYAADGSMVGRLAGIVEQLKTRVRIGGRILEFGCGAGDISAQCAREGYKVDAVDRSTKMIERAKSRFSNEGVDFSPCADSLNLPFPDGTFDGIVASSVLEYVSPLQAHLKELQRVCKADGYSFITVPNMIHPIRWLEAAERCLVSPFRGWLPVVLHEREDYLALSVNRLSMRQWSRAFSQAGWAIVGTEQRYEPLKLIIGKKGANVAANRAESL